MPTPEISTRRKSRNGVVHEMADRGVGTACGRQLGGSRGTGLTIQSLAPGACLRFRQVAPHEAPVTELVFTHGGRMSDNRATPASTAGACGLLRLRHGGSSNHLTWDAVLNLAVHAYWLRRSVKRKAAA